MNSKNPKVNFFVVGAPKSGTTSLYHYLAQHSDIFLPSKKELHYFSYNELAGRCNGPGDARVVSHCVQTELEYHAHYVASDGYLIVGDISPSYLFYPKTAKKIYDYNPDAKIVIILREHFNKAYSQYQHLMGVGREVLSFECALAAEKDRKIAGYSDFWLYHESTLYADQIDRYYDVFPQENIKILLLEELKEQPGLVLKDLCRFLGVDDQSSFYTDRVHNVSGEPRSKLLSKVLLAPNPLSDLIRKIVPQRIGVRVRAFLKRINTGPKVSLDALSEQRIRESFDADRVRLRELIGRDLPWE